MVIIINSNGIRYFKKNRVNSILNICYKKTQFLSNHNGMVLKCNINGIYVRILEY